MTLKLRNFDIFDKVVHNFGKSDEVIKKVSLIKVGLQIKYSS